MISKEKEKSSEIVSEADIELEIDEDEERCKEDVDCDGRCFSCDEFDGNGTCMLEYVSFVLIVFAYGTAFLSNLLLYLFLL